MKLKLHNQNLISKIKLTQFNPSKIHKCSKGLVLIKIQRLKILISKNKQLKNPIKPKVF